LVNPDESIRWRISQRNSYLVFQQFAIFSAY
jgi:hypothetical protein